MNRLISLFAVISLVVFSCFRALSQYQEGIAIETILKTDTTTTGQKIAFPEGEKDEVTILKITMPPGTSTGWHKHTLPVFAVVLEGVLTVELDNGEKLTFQKNSSFSEIYNTYHNGSNAGNKDVVLMACYLGQKNQPLTIRKEWKKPNPFQLNITQEMDEYQANILQNPSNLLVDLTKLIKDINLDIRYATTLNFTGKQVYTLPKAYLRQPVALALKKVQDSLSTYGLALKVFDAYRPYSATLKFAELISDTNYVASPRKGSRHNRGCAVDVTLIDKHSGKELDMPTPFDDFSPKAWPSCTNLPKKVIKNRNLLSDIMSHFGFNPISSEWWHFDFKGWDKYKLMDISFEELEKTPQ